MIFKPEIRLAWNRDRWQCRTSQENKKTLLFVFVLTDLRVKILMCFTTFKHISSKEAKIRLPISSTTLTFNF